MIMTKIKLIMIMMIKIKVEVMKERCKPNRGIER